MSIDTIYETPDYRYDWDSLAGVGWFTRKHDDHVSYINTGSDAIMQRESFEKLSNNALDTLLFEETALKQTYTKRWA